MSDTEERAALGLGCVKLGSAAAGGPAAGVRLVRHALDAGIAFFDTADAYGDGTSERVLGKALRGRRHGVTIATKAGYRFQERSTAERLVRRAAAPVLAARSARRAAAPASAGNAGGGGGSYRERDLSPAHLRTALEGSLRRLGTDHVDVFQLHGPVGVCGDDVVALMENLRREGKIGGFGVGLEALDHAADWLTVDGLAWMQLPFGVLDPEAGDALIPAARARGVRVIARGVFAAGLLADLSPGAEELLRPEQRGLRLEVRSVAAAHGLDPLALAAWFARSRPGVDTVLVGASSVAHVDANVAHLRAPAPPAEAVAALQAALDRHRVATPDPPRGRTP